jgi:hypothetical protein
MRNHRANDVLRPCDIIKMAKEAEDFGRENLSRRGRRQTVA